jgi:hypothetical protein
MSEEVKVDAPPAEEVKTETNGEAVKAEEQKPAATTTAAAPEKDASTLSEEDREALGAKVAKQSMLIKSLLLQRVTLIYQSTSTSPTPTFPLIDTSSP